MSDNISLYLKVRKEFKHKILSVLDMRDMSNEWSYFEPKYAPGTCPFYEMILDCECFDGGFISKADHDFLLNVIEECFYLINDDEYLEKLEQNRESKEYQDTLNETYALIKTSSILIQEVFAD